jgi:hypothetical protein
VPIGLCAVRHVFGRMHTMFRISEFREYTQPLLRLDAPVRARGILHLQKEVAAHWMIPGHRREDNKVRRTTLLMLALMAAVLVAASGAALAKNITGTDTAQKIVGTKYADHINALGGNDVVLGYRGADKIRGGDDNDQQYGGRGDDVIYSEGGFRDLVNGGKGIDTCYVDPKDRLKGCERKR